MSIYLDYGATTPLDPRVRRAMEPCLESAFGNPSSVHAWGREARHRVEGAREAIAGALGAMAEEIVFTSCGSEANNLAVKGVVLRHAGRPVHVVATAIEHASCLEPLRYLEERFDWARVTCVRPDTDGAVAVHRIEEALRPETALVSVMHCNNETGVVQPVEEIARVARRRGVLFHCDAVQSLGKIPLRVASVDCDLLTLSSHKIHGPKGAGLLFVRRGVEIDALVHGGGQEQWRRAGTENVAAICGFAEAVRIAVAEQETTHSRLQNLERIFLRELGSARFCWRINGDRARAVPGLMSISFPQARSEDLLVLCDLAGLAISAGSACHAGASEPSHVLQAMGLDSRAVGGAVRVSFGKTSTENEATQAAEILKEVAARACR